MNAFQRIVSVGDRVSIPLADGTVGAFISFQGFARHEEHFAVQLAPPGATGIPLVRVHSECITGDLFASQRCDCGAQLDEAMELLKLQGGFLLYLRQEGRGVGLAAKLAAYKLQEGGLDTYAANTALGLPADGRDYACAAQMLAALGIQRIRLLTNNPDKVRQLAALGIEVTQQISTGTFMTPFNTPYLQAKAHLTGHTLHL